MSAQPAAAERRLSLKEQQQRLREDVILRAVSGLIAEKGFDLMTVDEVAAVVGIAKASLYKHFESKEALAAAAMVRLLDRTLEVIAAQPESAAPVDRLKAVLRWALREHLAGRIPSLPSTRSTLREVLARYAPWVERLGEASTRLRAWIESARERGEIAAGLPTEIVLYTLVARACDPTSDYLKLLGTHRDDEIVELVIVSCFDGLAARRP